MEFYHKTPNVKGMCMNKTTGFVTSMLLCSSIVLNCSEVAVSKAVVDVPLPSEKNVEIYKNKIIRDIKKGRSIKYAMLGTTGVALSYLVYKLFVGDSVEGASQELDNKALTSRLLKVEENYNEHFDADMFSSQWARNTGKSALNSFVSAGLGYFVWSSVERLFKRYNCFENLECFASHQLSGMKALDNLVVVSAYLDSTYTLSDKNLEREKTRFIATLKGVVYAVEATVAFMQHKLDIYLSDNALLTQQELAIKKELFACTTAFCQKVHMELENNTGNVSFEQLSNEFVLYVNSLIRTFEFIEARINWV